MSCLHVEEEAIIAANNQLVIHSSSELSKDNDLNGADPMRHIFICLVNNFTAVILDPIAAMIVLTLVLFHAGVFPVQIPLSLEEVAKNGRDGNISLRRTDTRDLLRLSRCSAGSMEVVSLAPL